MISPPHRLSAPTRYCRLLPAFQYAKGPHNVEQRLNRLAESMFEKNGAAAPATEFPLAAAYTYFGQFITHDLTFDGTAFRDAGQAEPEETINGRTPALDLDSIYGDGPGSANHGHLYDGISFRIGAARTARGALFDVPLIDNFPAVADSRNCENAMLRQIHAMFLLLHNAAVQKRIGSGPVGRVFESARALVRWQFQWLVRNDFLLRVCKREIYQAVIVDEDRRIVWPPGCFSIPVEFSQAAARFGHSMVRSKYRMTERGREVSLGELFGSTHRPGALASEMAVDWSHFMRPRSENSMLIDTHLVDPLLHLPDDSIHPFVVSPGPHEPHALALRTLSRGAATKLPTGQQLRDALDPTAVIPEESEGWKNARACGFARDTPLWYYLLLEAEVNERGLTLGAVGSRIVAEVIEASLRHDPESFLFQNDGAWAPSKWKTPDGTVSPIRNLAELATVVGL